MTTFSKCYSLLIWDIIEKMGINGVVRGNIRPMEEWVWIGCDVCAKSSYGNVTDASDNTRNDDQSVF